MAFTADVLPDVLLEVEEIFRSPTTTSARYALEPQTAAALLPRQTSSSAPRMDGTTCVGTKVWFFDPGANGTIYEGSTPDGDLGCDTVARNYGQTNGSTLSNNIFFHDGKAAQEERCASALGFAKETASVLYHLMYEMRLALNKKIINAHIAAAQQNQVPTAQMPSYITERSASNILEIPPTNMNQTNVWETLVDLNTISTQNSLYNPLIINGKNFLNSSVLAQYNALNDNQRSEGAFFAQGGLAGNMVWDIHTTHGIDAISTELTSLAVTPNSYIFWNFTEYPETPILKDPSANLWVFSMADPLLTYNDNGTVKRVMYDVEHTYTCTGRDANGKKVFKHNYELFLKGGYALAPAGYDMTGSTQTYTGTMHYVVTSGS